MDEGFADYFCDAITNDEQFGEDVGSNRHMVNSLTVADRTLDMHHDGQIIGGACWNLRQALSGTDLLVFRALQLTPQPHTWSSFANNLVTADDDDGNLSNGTPHLETIRQKFYAKNIYFTAGPPQSPQNIVADFITSGGNVYPRLTWSSMVEPDVVSGGSILIERRVNPMRQGWTAWSTIATIAGTTTQYTDYNILHACSDQGCPDQIEYRLRASDQGQLLSSYSSSVSITGYNVPHKESAYGPLAEAPSKFALTGNYPNPFNPSTTIRYSLAQAGHVQLTIYNAVGQEVAKLIDEYQEASFYGVVFHGERLASGIYYAHLRVTDQLNKDLFQETSRLVLTK